MMWISRDSRMDGDGVDHGEGVGSVEKVPDVEKQKFGKEASMG